MGDELASQVLELRSQGLTDDLVQDELTKKGFKADDVHAAIMQADSGGGEMSMGSDAAPPSNYGNGMQYQQQPSDNNTEFSRVEEIAESIIDEKWDELIKEVQKIIDWKDRVEEKQMKVEAELQKLKEDFTTLHQGVLGKLDQYDTRMRDVGVELKAVGNVFKDVIPEFVDNVKEMGRLVKK